MRTLALGNNISSLIKQRLKTSDFKVSGLKQRGFTLMELMVVVAIIAIASAGVMMAIPDASATALEREALRLSALLDSARAQSRASGLAITWKQTDDGFEFEGIPKIKNSKTGEMEAVVSYPKTWLNSETTADTGSRLALGPEPVIAKQELVLKNAGRSLTLSTDGIRPFAIKSSDQAP